MIRWRLGSCGRAARRRLRVIGTTTKAPALAWHLDALGNDYTFFLADSRHNEVWLYLDSLKSKPAIGDAARRAALVAALSTRFTFPAARVDKVPSIPLAALAHEGALQTFTGAWDAIIDDVRRVDGTAIAAARP